MVARFAIYTYAKTAFGEVDAKYLGRALLSLFGISRHGKMICVRSQLSDRERSSVHSSKRPYFIRNNQPPTIARRHASHLVSLRSCLEGKGQPKKELPIFFFYSRSLFFVYGAAAADFATDEVVEVLAGVHSGSELESDAARGRPPPKPPPSTPPPTATPDA